MFDYVAGVVINAAGVVMEETWLIEVGQRAHDQCDFCFLAAGQCEGGAAQGRQRSRVQNGQSASGGSAGSALS
jgi:hypothetical protein